MRVTFTIDVNVDPWESDDIEESTKLACNQIDELFYDEFGLEVETKFVIHE